MTWRSIRIDCFGAKPLAMTTIRLGDEIKIILFVNDAELSIFVGRQEVFWCFGVSDLNL